MQGVQGLAPLVGDIADHLAHGRHPGLVEQHGLRFPPHGDFVLQQGVVPFQVKDEEQGDDEEEAAKKPLAVSPARLSWLSRMAP